VVTQKKIILMIINNSYEYKPFGDMLSTSAGETAGIGFLGQEQDIESRHSSGSALRSEMVWLNDTARYYDPEIRQIQEF
jgi:hypothetical protein